MLQLDYDFVFSCTNLLTNFVDELGSVCTVVEKQSGSFETAIFIGCYKNSHLWTLNYKDDESF